MSPDSPTAAGLSRPEPGRDPLVRIEPSRIELSVGGMTCGSCANRVERALNRMHGVQASVNFATETASVRYPPDLDPAELVARVDRGRLHR